MSTATRILELTRVRKALDAQAHGLFLGVGFVPEDMERLAANIGINAVVEEIRQVLGEPDEDDGPLLECLAGALRHAARKSHEWN